MKPPTTYVAADPADDFRAITGAVTLKLDELSVNNAGDDLFPRHNRRGHIEAKGN